MDPASGSISGTPTLVSASTSYTVTASNSSGSTTAHVSITVNDVVPSIAYAQATYTFATGAPVSLLPTASGGAVVSWSVSPALPAGLVLSASTGGISGTPTTITGAAQYIVTAQNSGGSATVPLTLAVENGTLLDLGATNAFYILQFDHTRVLTKSDGHWILWDYATRQNLANGDAFIPGRCGLSPCRALGVAVAGPTLVIETPTGLELRSSADGTLINTVLLLQASWWRLANDGSYVCAGSSTGLTVWSPAGAPLLQLAGDYSKAAPFAAPQELRIATGPAGAAVIETISLPGGSDSVSAPFQGQFNKWFLDGNRFLTNVSNTVWVYSKTVVQEDLAPLPTTWNLTGQGNWFWTATVDAGLQLYAVGSKGVATATYAVGYAPVIPSGLTVGLLLEAQGIVRIVDLSGAAPVVADHAVPPVTIWDQYAATSSSQWLLGTQFGVLLDGAADPAAPRYFDYGYVRSIAGGGERVAVATTSGRILIFNGTTKTLEHTINLMSSKVAMSSDGSVLAVVDGDFVNGPPRALRVFSLPSATQIASFPTQNPRLFDFSLSGSGSVLGEYVGVPQNGGGFCVNRQAVPVMGGPAIWAETPACGSVLVDLAAPLLSPDGTLVAVSDRPDGIANPSTTVFKNAVLSTAVSGSVEGWIDNSRFVVNQYPADYHYAGATIYDSTGLSLGSPPFPWMRSFQVLSSDTLYSPSVNAIVSVSSGASVWTSPSSLGGQGAVGGTRVVFASGRELRAEPWR